MTQELKYPIIDGGCWFEDILCHIDCPHLSGREGDQYEFGSVNCVFERHPDIDRRGKYYIYTYFLPYSNNDKLFKTKREAMLYLESLLEEFLALPKLEPCDRTMDDNKDYDPDAGISLIDPISISHIIID